MMHANFVYSLLSRIPWLAVVLGRDLAGMAG